MSDDIGPSLSEVLSTANAGTKAMWGLSAVMAVATIALSVIQHVALYRAPYSNRRQLFLSIIQLAPIAVTCSFMSLFFPRATDLLEMMRACFEAITVYSFVLMLVDMMGGSLSTIARLEKEAPRKILSGGPCCCFFRVCDRPRYLTDDLLAWCLRFGKQFYYTVPTISFIRIFILLEREGDLSQSSLISILLGVVQFISILFAMYGLFILYLATITALIKFKITYKLLAIKLVILVASVQKIVIGFVISNNSTADPTIDDGQLFHPDYRQSAWHNFLLCLECLPLAILLYKAFPSSELGLMFDDDAETTARIENKQTKENVPLLGESNT